jgi:uncharacterized protein (TIGR00661 family)
MKILYGVPGEGMGHATRSKVIINHLIKNHDIRIVASSRAFTFLSKLFPGKVYEINGLYFAYKDGSVDKLETVKQILKTGVHDILGNLQVYRHISKEFTPDIVITDFETSAYLYGKYLDIPIIDIDNIQVITRCKLEIDIPSDEKDNYRIAKGITSLRVPSCYHYFLSTFFNPEIIKENTTLVPPILRDEIINAKTGTHDHILIYQTSSSQTTLLDILNDVSKEKFLVYGFNKDEVVGNCQLKSFSEIGFINDLATAKGVITNGGYSLISEAIYLKKPVCSFPVENQFEQFVNAAYIEKLNYGKHMKAFNSDGVKAFVYDLDKYVVALENYSQNGNELLFRELDNMLSTIKK